MGGESTHASKWNWRPDATFGQDTKPDGLFTKTTINEHAQAVEDFHNNSK